MVELSCRARLQTARTGHLQGLRVRLICFFSAVSGRRQKEDKLNYLCEDAEFPILFGNVAPKSLTSSFSSLSWRESSPLRFSNDATYFEENVLFPCWDETDKDEAELLRGRCFLQLARRPSLDEDPRLEVADSSESVVDFDDGFCAKQSRQTSEPSFTLLLWRSVGDGGCCAMT